MKRAARAFVPLVLAALSCAPAVAAAAAPSLAGAGDTGFGEVLHQQLLLRGGPLGKVATAWPKSTAGLQRTRRPPATSAPAARPPGGREVLVASVAGFGLVGATSLGLTSSAALHVEGSRPVASANPPCASARASLGQPPASASLGLSEAVLWPAGRTRLVVFFTQGALLGGAGLGAALAEGARVGQRWGRVSAAFGGGRAAARWGGASERLSSVLAASAATLCDPGCNLVQPGLQPYVTRAATSCSPGCSPR